MTTPPAPRNPYEYLPDLDAYRLSLTKGYTTLVSAEDFPRVSQHRWGISVIKGVPYASRGAMIGGKQRIEYLHRFILRPQPGQHVDHANHDTLDNQRANIRVASPAQNQANRKNSKSSQTGYVGVQRSKRSCTFIAQFAGRYLGSYATAEEAAKARDIAAVEQFGTFAATNFPASELVVKPNRRLPSPKTSIFVGVRRVGARWQASVSSNGRRKYIGTFATEVEAALARDAAQFAAGKPAVNILPGWPPASLAVAVELPAAA